MKGIRRPYRLSWRAPHREAGFALITVMMIMAVLSLVTAGVVTDALGSLSTSRHAEDWNAALAAADSGADDLSYRLNANQNTSYTLAQQIQCAGLATTTQPSTCSGLPASAQIQCTGPGAWVGLANCNTWATIPGGVDDAQYQYSIPAGTNGTTGLPADYRTIVLDVTGQAGVGSALVKRSVRVTLTRTTYLNYGYFTDRETEDPATYGSPEYSSFGVPVAAAYQYCQSYWFSPPASTDATYPYAGVTMSTDPRSLHSQLPSTSSSVPYTATHPCTFTKWESGDNFNGPVGTNDVMFVNGNTTFNGPVTVGHPCWVGTTVCPGGATATNHPQATSLNSYGKGNDWIDTGQYLSNNPASPKFNGGITAQQPIPIPPDNSALPSLASSAANAGQGGCTYWGPTRIHFNSDGTMTVLSPDTVKGSTSTCPVNGSTTMSIPPDGVIYVDNWTSTGTGDPTVNQPTSTCVPPPSSFLQLAVTPGSHDTVLDPDAPTCAVGNAYVGGSFGKNQVNDTSSLTIGSDNNVVVYQNTTYTDPTAAYMVTDSNGNKVFKTDGNTAVLGLEPTNSVDLYHPVLCAYGSNCASSSNWQNMEYPTSTCPQSTGSACTVYNVDAAVIAYNHAFQLENYWYGPSLSGAISFLGSLAERYRGRMAGTGFSGYTGSQVGPAGSGSGYSKSYSYDGRFAYLTPPSFLPPNIFSWTQAQWADTTTTFAR